MTRVLALLFVVASWSIACPAQQGNAQSEPSLQETFDWMTNTLKPAEGNVSVIHRPYQRPYPKEWVEERIDPYHREVIEKFSHDGCQVEFDVEVTDNDMGFLLGKHFLMHDMDTFDLKDINPKSVRVQDSCAPFDTPEGSTTPSNCEDTQGTSIQLGFSTPEYAKRFAKAFRHAVELCGGKPSNF